MLSLTLQTVLNTFQQFWMDLTEISISPIPWQGGCRLLPDIWGIILIFILLGNFAGDIVYASREDQYDSLT